MRKGNRRRCRIQDAGIRHQNIISKHLSYKDLEIYKLAFKLAIEVHNMTMTLPKFELFEEGSQIRRSSKSVPSNIVEGYGKRNYKNELLRSLTIAHKECDETLNHLNLIWESKSLKNKDLYNYLHTEYIKLSKMISSFNQTVLKITFQTNNFYAGYIIKHASCILFLNNDTYEKNIIHHVVDDYFKCFKRTRKRICS